MKKRRSKRIGGRGSQVWTLENHNRLGEAGLERDLAEAMIATASGREKVEATFAWLALQELGYESFQIACVCDKGKK